MSNHQTCPVCGVITSDATYPAPRVGYFVSQQLVDGLRGTEDPAEVIMNGELAFDCACGRAFWVAERGWFIRAGDCKACEHRRSKGLEGQCPSCANERVRAERAAERGQRG